LYFLNISTSGALGNQCSSFGPYKPLRRRSRAFGQRGSGCGTETLGSGAFQTGQLNTLNRDYVPCYSSGTRGPGDIRVTLPLGSWGTGYGWHCKASCWPSSGSSGSVSGTSEGCPFVNPALQMRAPKRAMRCQGSVVGQQCRD
jgi:hypothetical protein